jgi:hypothetical protein
MRKKLKSVKGSSLVEILVAIALFGAVSVPLLSLFMGSAIMIKQSKENIKVAEIERHIKADVVYASNDIAERLFVYPINDVDTPHKVLQLPTSGTANGYGIFDYEYNKCDAEYKYSVTFIPNDHSSTNRLYANAIQNESVGTRYKIDIYKLKARGIDRAVDNNFKLVKTFFLETTT